MMINKLFNKGLFTVSLITLCLSASAQDSTSAAKPAPVKPKPAPIQTAVTKPQVTTQGKTPTTKTPNLAASAQVTPAQPATYTNPAPVNDRSINGQYQALLSKTYGYQRPYVAAFYKSISDSLNAERKKIKPLQANVKSLTDTVKELHKQLASQQETLTASTEHQDSINFLGIPMSKSSYNTMMWGLVIVFAAVAAFVIFRAGSHSREAKYRIKLYEELDEEYKTYKAKANEKEKKLARDLQTARNKIEEITGKPEY